MIISFVNGLTTEYVLSFERRRKIIKLNYMGQIFVMGFISNLRVNITARLYNSNRSNSKGQLLSKNKQYLN